MKRDMLTIVLAVLHRELAEYGITDGEIQPDTRYWEIFSSTPDPAERLATHLRLCRALSEATDARFDASNLGAYPTPQEIAQMADFQLERAIRLRVISTFLAAGLSATYLTDEDCDPITIPLDDLTTNPQMELTIGGRLRNACGIPTLSTQIYESATTIGDLVKALKRLKLRQLVRQLATSSP